MTMHRNWIIEPKSLEMQDIRAANNGTMKVECAGTVDLTVNLNNERTNIQIRNVLGVPSLTANLLSVSQLVRKSFKVIFDYDGCEIRDEQNNLLALGLLEDGLFRLSGVVVPSGLALLVKEENSMKLWHRRLAHLNWSDMAKMKNGGVNGMSYVDEGINACVACCKGKQSQKPFSCSGSSAKRLLEVVHADLFSICCWRESK